MNGQANEAVYKSTTFTLYSISEFIDRNVVVEEFTGTGCGWCPRGLVGMEKLRETFGDRFVGIGLHQYNSSDAMYINPKNYARISFGGAPSCRIDRGEEIDPYYGTENDICDDFRAEMAVPALATIAVSGTLNEDATKVDATATVQALFDESYSLEFVLIGDGLKGTGASWNQANYYAQYSATQLPADLAIFGSGGTYGQSSVKGWAFNDVALASSYANGSNEAGQLTLTAGTPQEAAYTLTLPTSTKLKGAIKTDQLYVAALLVDGNGRIANAAKAKVTNEGGTAVSAIQSADAAVVARYSLDGRQLSAPQKGLNIVKLSDGRTVKVLVK